MIFLPGVRRRLIERLLSERNQGHALERYCADAAQEVIYDRSDWVSAYVDTGNVVSRAGGLVTATRAITLQDRLIWLVRSTQYRRAFHSRKTDPGAAIDDAETAWRRRRDMRAYRDSVREIVRDLRRGRLRYDIRVDDAYASPLCEEGVDGFLRSIGLGRFTTFPGWFIAWCFALDRQVGFVIWEAHQRHLRDCGAGRPAPSAG